MEKIKKQKAFTLVELIIVITILAVLATIAFLSFQSYTKNGRDSVRLINISDISKALQTQKTTTGNYPTPENIYGTGHILGVNLFHVGKVDTEISKLLRFQSLPVDPLTKQPYPYGLSLDNKYYQVAAAFENLQAQNTLVSQTNAQTYKAKVEGNYRGLLKFSSGSNQYIGNIPSLIFSRTGEYELISEEPYFIVNNGTNLPYSFDGSSFSGTQTKEQILQEVTGEPVTLTGIVVGDWETNKDNLISSLGYPGDVVGVEVLGTQYYTLPTTSSYGPSLSCSILHDANNGTANGNFQYQNQYNGKIYFAGSGGTLWGSDGTILGTTEIHTVKPSSFMTEFKGELYFPGTTTASGTELWKSDGTTAGTAILKDIAPGSASSTPYIMGKDANYLYFSVFNTTSPQLWRTDGTNAGTIRIGTFTWGLSQLYTYNGITYFTVEGSGLGKELWKTDGTLAGTVIVKDIKTGANVSSNPGEFIGYNGKLYFFADSQSSGREFFVSDGTSAGTVMVKDINSGTGSSSTSSSEPIEFNGQIYFAAQSGSGMELWKSDGTSTGTVMVKDINPGAGGSNPSSLTIYKNELYFVASSIGDYYNTEIWKTDGTEAGTVKISDVDIMSYIETYFYLHNGKLYFLVRDGLGGIEIWNTDGITFQRIKDINLGAADSVKINYTMHPSVGGKFFFYAYHPDFGTELWFTDGTEAGTQITMDINPGTAGIGSYTSYFVSLGNKVIFLANTADKGDEVWKCE